MDQVKKKNLRDQIEHMKIILDEKIIELEKNINESGQTLEHQIDHNIKNTQSKIETINHSITVSNDLIHSTLLPINHLIQVEKLSPELRYTSLINEPQVNDKMFTLPNKNLKAIEDYIRGLKYKNSENFNHLDIMNDLFTGFESHPFSDYSSSSEE